MEFAGIEPVGLLVIRLTSRASYQLTKLENESTRWTFESAISTEV